MSHEEEDTRLAVDFLDIYKHMRRRIHEEDTRGGYTYEEEDTRLAVDFLDIYKYMRYRGKTMKRYIGKHIHIHACHLRRRIHALPGENDEAIHTHACQLRRRIHTWRSFSLTSTNPCQNCKASILLLVDVDIPGVTR
jgi:hypothetical protein